MSLIEKLYGNPEVSYMRKVWQWREGEACRMVKTADVGANSVRFY